MEQKRSGVLKEQIDIPSALVRLREEKGLSQRDVSEAAGMNHGTLGLIEARITRNPGILTLTRIANAMDISVTELLRRSTVHPEQPQSLT